jgi:hypothetical protein
LEQTNLNRILNFLGEKIKDQGFHLNIKANVFFEIVNQKSERYKKFKKNIESEWETFIVERNDHPKKKTYTHFLYIKFDEYFRFFIREFFGLNQNQSLNLISKEELSEKNLIIEYSYKISKNELQSFKNLSEKLKNNVYNLSFPTAYLFFVVALLGITIRKTINEDMLWEMRDYTHCFLIFQKDF